MARKEVDFSPSHCLDNRGMAVSFTKEIYTGHNKQILRTSELLYRYLNWLWSLCP